MQLSARQQMGGNSPLPRRAALDDAAGWGSLHVTGGARIIGADKRRCQNTTGGYQSLWMPRMALGPRLQLKAGFFARRTTLRSFEHRSEIAWPIHTDRRFF
jgi:hypothetical protein